MAINVKKAINTKNENIKMIIYGKSGTKKTRFACNGIKKGLVIDMENGLGSTEDIDNLDVISVTNAYEFTEALDYLEENQNVYDTVIIDSFTQYSDMLYVALLEVYPEPEAAITLWGSLDKISRQRLEQIMRIKSNFCIIMLEEQVTLDTGFVSAYPMYKAKKFKATLEAKPSIIAHAAKNKDGDVVYDLIGSNVAVAKNRFYKELISKKIGSKKDDDIRTFQELIDTITHN